MTEIYNDPAGFTEDILAGFLDANARADSGGVGAAGLCGGGQGEALMLRVWA